MLGLRLAEGLDLEAAAADLDVPAWQWGAFLALVVTLVLLDMLVFHRDAHEVSLREAGTWSVIWVTLALVFNYAFYRYSVAAFGEAGIDLERPVVTTCGSGVTAAVLLFALHMTAHSPF